MRGREAAAVGGSGGGGVGGVCGTLLEGVREGGFGGRGERAKPG
jgi:hypothetical protein